MEKHLENELKMEQSLPLSNKREEYQDIEDEAYIKELQRLVNTKLFRSARQFRQQFRAE